MLMRVKSCVYVCAHEFVWSPDLEKPVKEDDADELVLCVSLADDERQRDGGGQLVAAVGLGKTRLSEGGGSKGNRTLPKLK